MTIENGFAAVGSGGGPRELCDACGFDSDLYDRADTLSSLPIIAEVLAAATEVLGNDVLAARPDPTTWSIVEYVDHVREVAFGNRMAVEVALNDPGVDLGRPVELEVPGAPRRLEVADVLDGVAREYELMKALLSGLTDVEWTVEARLADVGLTVGWFARHLVHEGLHHLADIGRLRFAHGFGAAPGFGSVVGLQVSGGGVPKLPVESLGVAASGVEGDVQADRRHHGRPVQAVCLWSAEVIAALGEEGHPIHHGSAGENITIGGVEWADLRPGSRIEVGPIPMLISAHAIPCAKNAQWFRDRDFNRILHDRHPGWSRLYAIPLSSGRVAVGDPVVVEGG